MQQANLRSLGALLFAATCLLFCSDPSFAQTKSGSGKLAGVVDDTSGIPQMGATVDLIAEATGATVARDFLTNTQGVFRGERLTPGLYTLRVTLAGFLPTLQQHVRVNAHLTTVVRIQLESMFASLDQLRRQPSSVQVANDDWKWVLRSASAERPILQWVDNDDAQAGLNTAPVLDVKAIHPRAQLEFTDGARRPGSVSNVPSAPATAFAYDQKLGGASRVILAGEMNYDDSAPGGAFATVWLPTGTLSNGPRSTLVLREAKLGPNGATFRGVRASEAGSISLGDRTQVRYGGEYVLVGLMKSASAIRPDLQLERQFSEDWHATLIFAAEPGAGEPLETGDGDSSAVLAAALNELDAFPTLLWRHGRPVLEGGWHEELAVDRKLGAHGKLQVAAFHDDNAHVAVFGRGNDLPSEYFQDYFSNGFAYDGSASNSWGGRAAFRQALTDNIDVTAIYSFAGALSPSVVIDSRLRDMLRTSMHHSLGGNISARLPRTHTRVDAGYKWVNGTIVSRLDAFGDSLFQVDPFFHVGVRQALPKFGPGRWEAIADCDNLLAQGYVPLNTRDGHAVLVPTFRTFRGGLSVQF